MNALPDTEGTLHACCMASAAEDCLQGNGARSPDESIRFATWEPDGPQETERGLSVSQSRFLFFLSPLRPPCTLFRQRGPSPFQQCPCSCLRLLLLPAQS